MVLWFEVWVLFIAYFLISILKQVDSSEITTQKVKRKKGLSCINWKIANEI